eukprot:78455-Hanusia_phi.AAC.1
MRTKEVGGRKNDLSLEGVEEEEASVVVERTGLANPLGPPNYRPLLDLVSEVHHPRHRARHQAHGPRPHPCGRIRGGSSGRGGGRRKEGGRKEEEEEGGRREEGGGRRKEEGGRRKEEGGG